MDQTAVQISHISSENCGTASAIHVDPFAARAPLKHVSVVSAAGYMLTDDASSSDTFNDIRVLNLATVDTTAQRPNSATTAGTDCIGIDAPQSVSLAFHSQCQA